MPKEKLIVYFGHHKCASVYISKVLLQFAWISGKRFARRDVRSSYPQFSDTGVWKPASISTSVERVIADKLDVVCVPNSSIEYLNELVSQRQIRGFHVIRDPRDIVVSAYFSHLHSHRITACFPWIAEARARFKDCSDINYGLDYELDLLDSQFLDMKKWNYHSSDILELKFEDLIENPEYAFRAILPFVGLNIVKSSWLNVSAGFTNLSCKQACRKAPFPVKGIPEALFTRVLNNYSFERLSKGRERGREDVLSHYRSGVAGDWRRYFSPDLKQKFKRRYGDLLIQLGYERSDQW